MCLDIVDKKINRSICTGVGYKVYTKSRNRLFPVCFNNGVELPRHRWLRENKFAPYKGGTIYSAGPNHYKRGWHIFTTRRDAREWAIGLMGPYKHECECVLRVEYRSVLVTGIQNGHDVIVAKWIRIGGSGKIK